MLMRNRNYFILFVLTFFLQNFSQAASLSLEFTDESGKPVVNAVAALIPANKISYAQKAKGIMDQRNNMFVPGVLAVRVNTLVYFPNGDDVRHQVYSFSPAKRFELRLYHGLTAEPVLFDQPGQVILGCNIHDSMLGYIYVVDTEHFTVSDEKGQLTINAIPAGNYTLEIQHPKLEKSPPEKKLTLTADETSNQKIIITGLAEEKKDDAGSLNSMFK